MILIASFFFGSGDFFAICRSAVRAFDYRWGTKMNINASIIDQRLVSVVADVREQAANELNVTNDVKLKSLAFVYLCVKTMLDLDADEAFDCLTEGGGDFGIDAMHITGEIDGEFGVTLFQGKYKANLEASSNFEENGIKALLDGIRYIFDPSATLHSINERLRTKVEEARSLIRDGLIPRVRAIACNNGIKWNSSAQDVIDRANLGSQVTWDYVNHDVLLNVLQRSNPVNATLRLVGKAIVEDLNFSRVCVGRIPVVEIAELMKIHGERLLERNIRRYLGLHGNRVNEGIQSTLESDQSSNFYFFNNGLTLVCSDFTYNALQSSNYQINVDNLQIVNGGQTSMTIAKTLEQMQRDGKAAPVDASVLVRIYKLPKENDVVLQITHATNSQNPVDLKDLRSNDGKQLQLEESVKLLGFTYRRKRMDAPAGKDITSGIAAEALLAVWRKKPHQAKFFAREHFGKLYDTTFDESLNAAQLIIAVLLYRIAENHRRRPAHSDPVLVRYASCFIAMQKGRYLLEEAGSTFAALDHRNFAKAKQLVDQRGEAYFNAAVSQVRDALDALYGKNKEISMQQLSATFRRGDLIGILQAMDVPDIS